MIPNTSVLAFPSLKRTQRYGAKVKTGCQTCKTRRVKCDEERPECRRCTSTGRKCDGYSQSAALGSVPFKPSSSISHPQSEFFRGAVHRQLYSTRSTISNFADLGDSVLYLEFYQQCAIPALASHFDREFWSRIVLQIAQSEPSVRHAVVTLGYLSKTESGNIKEARPVSATDKTLLLHYNKAMRHLIERMAEPSCSVEVGLVACMLFICIEFLRGDYPTALAHLYSGLKIIAEWRRRTLKSAQHNLPLPSPSVVAGDVQDIGTGIISRNLIPMFIRAMTTGLLAGAPYEPLLEPYCPRPQQIRTFPFTSLFEAQSAFHELQNTAVIVISVLFRKLSAGPRLSPDDLNQHSHLLFCLDSWFHNLQRLESEGSLTPEEGPVISSAKVAYYAIYIALAGSVDILQLSFDKYLPHFQALNHHAKIAIDAMDLPERGMSSLFPTPTLRLCADSIPASSRSRPSPTPIPESSRRKTAHFTFEGNVIFPLYIAATRCRCPVTRRESLRLLEKNPPREGLSDAEQQALVARRVMEIEESEVDEETGWPIQGTRLVAPVFNGEIDNFGGIWASFTSVAWIMRGRAPDDPQRHRGDREPKHPFAEWEEWLKM